MNWFNIRLHVLLVLLISWHSLTEARDSDEEKVPREQKVDSVETDTKEKGRANTPANLVDQIFSQPALRPSLAYQPGESINYNIGYNLGRTIGKTPFLGASLDRQADASKVVLVLANDSPETSNLPQPDGETLKRLVRTPGFWDQFASQMATFNQQLSEQVPAMSRTVGAGINEFISQTPMLGDAKQTGALDFANLGEAFGQKLVAPNLFLATDDSNSGNADNDSTTSAPSETERVENELSSNMGNPLKSNPLFQGLQSFVPPGFPTPPSFANMFPSVPAWPWMGQNQEGAASDISEVRVKPDDGSPYKISPKEGVTQKMTEMKLRAAMKDALDKKTIPILWFSLPASNEKHSTSDNNRPVKPPTPTSEEDLIMRSKLAAFEKQLISELKQLQEVVKLANAMKKAQLESKGMKFDVTDVISPLALNNTPIYKITLADIEKTLKDEYVRKLMQMIYNSQHRDMQQNEGNPEGSNTKYSTDITGSPNKRQATTASEAMAHLNKDDMTKMMAYAYRMAAANGQEVPWQTGLEDSSNGMTMQQHSPPRQWIDSQSNMQNEQQRMPDSQQQVTMSADDEADMSEERKHKQRPGHGRQRPHHHVHSHDGHFPRQWIEPNSQMQQSGNEGSFQGQKEPTPEQRQWIESNTQMKQQPFQQTMSQQAEQRQWLEPKAQMNQKQFQQNMLEQAKQRQWLESNAQMKQQRMQQTIAPNAEQRQWLESNAQIKQQPFQQTTPQQAGQRQWLEANAQMKQQADERQWLEANAQIKHQQFQQGMQLNAEQRQSLESNAQMKQQQFQQTIPPQAEQRQWLEPNGQMKQPSQLQSQMPMQMRQSMPMSTESQMSQQPPNDAKDPNMQMRQWVDNAGPQTATSGSMTETKADMAMQQQRQMLPPKMGQPSKSNEQFDPNMSMRQSTGPAETSSSQLQTQTENERKMSQNPQFQMNEHQQLKMANSGGPQQTQMANKEGQPQSQDTTPPMQRQTPDNQADLQQNAPHTAEKMSKPDERQMKAKPDQGMPINNEATPQMPENAGKERHKGLDDFLDDFDLFGHNSHKGKDKKNNRGPTINYYYNAGGSRYPPTYASSGGYSGGYGGYAPPPPPPSYGYGGGYARPVRPPSYGGYARPPPSPPKYAPQSGYYGGGGYGSNAYGSRGGYRTATGDDEIEEMLRQHQTLPKMMLLIQTRDDNRQPTNAKPNTGSSRTTTSTDVPSPSSSPSADNKADLRSLAKRPKRKPRRRSKRSAEFASLEPIDESSLIQLRKTYKNSLKEITLNPNETPAEALMRYNADSVREALAKASKEPMEISAGDASEEVGEKVSHEETQQQVSSSYAMDNGGYMSPMPTTPAYNQNHASGSPLSGLSHTQHHYTPQLKSQYTSPSQLATYNSQHIQPHYQHQQYSEVSSLYPYQTKAFPHNAYGASGHNTYEQASYVEDYSVPSSPYQLNHNNAQYGGLNTAPISSNPTLYSTPYDKPDVATFSPQNSPFTTEFPLHANAISKTHQQPANYGSSNYMPDIFQRKMPQVRGHYEKATHSKNSYKTHSRTGNAGHKDIQYYERTQRQDADKDAGDNDDSMGNLYEAMKERLSDCCNDCKEKLLKDLTETLKRQLQSLPKAKSKLHRNSNRNQYQQVGHDNNAEDANFGDWVHEMVGKGYDKQYLTREHQKNYKKNHRIQLALDEREGAEEIMYGDNQSYKRDTTIAGIDTEMVEGLDADPDAESNADMDLMTTEQLNSSKADKVENDPQTEEVEIETTEDGERVDNINEKLENVNSSEEPKQDPKTHTLEPAESTTHSIYALRGKYKTKKHHATDTLTKIYGKKIGGYKNLKLLRDTKSLNKSKYFNQDLSKVISKKDVEKHKNLEEILDLLYELSKARKEMNKISTAIVEGSTSTISSTTTKPSIYDQSEEKSSKPVSSSPPGKPKRRKLKSSRRPRKSSKSVGDRSKDSKASDSSN